MNGADAVSREEAIEVIRSKAQRYCLSKESSYMGIVEWSDSLVPTEEAVDAIKGLRCIDQPKTDTWSIKDIAKALEKHGLVRLDQEPCEDCISRKEVIENIRHAQVNFSVESDIDFTKHKREVQEIADGILNAQIKALEKLPSVTPQEPKTGRWIDFVTCSCCGWEFIDDVLQSPNMVWFPYCPNCGAKMEVSE